MKAALLMAAALAAAPGLARAQTPDWSLDLGAAGRVRPTHLGSDRYVADAVPIIEAKLGDSVSISFDDGVKWTLARSGPFEAGALAEYRQSYNDSLPAGVSKPRDAVELGGFAAARTPLGILEARLRQAVNGYKGLSGDLAFDTGAPLAAGFELAAQARLSWADHRFTAEALPPFPGVMQGSRDAFLTLGGELDLAHPLGQRTRVVLALSADRMVGALPLSPVLASRDVYTAALGLTYHWSSTPEGSR